MSRWYHIKRTPIEKDKDDGNVTKRKQKADAPTEVVLAIEDEGYPIAEAGGNFVHLHDKWLADNPKDYDCIAHELAAKYDIRNKLAAR